MMGKTSNLTGREYKYIIKEAIKRKELKGMKVNNKAKKIYIGVKRTAHWFPSISRSASEAVFLIPYF